MPAVVLVGAQWGDEGKGRVIDHLASRAGMVIRFQGGWRTDTSGCRRWDDLPAEARAYLERIAGLAAAPIRFVSVGPERSQIIVRC